MNSVARFVATDLGASSGRIITGVWDGKRFDFQEVHRFPNGPVHEGGGLHWDVPGLWAQIQEGLRKAGHCFGDSPDGIGVDAWGVDFGLVNPDGALASKPYHYRDSRTSGLPPKFFELFPEPELFRETGVQVMEINTLFQLCSVVGAGTEALGSPRTLLMIPDLFHYFLCGVRVAEFTEATTTQMYSPTERDWSEAITKAAGVPRSWLPPIVSPGTCIGMMLPDLQHELAFERSVPIIATASHDTADAVAAIPGMDDRSAFLSSGTWSLLGVQTARPDTSDEAFRLNFTNEGGPDGGWLLLKNITGLWIVQECQRHWSSLGSPSAAWADLIKDAMLADPLRSAFDPDHPSLQVQSDMPAAIQGYCRRTGQPVPQSAGEIVRCAFESLCLKYRATLDSLELLTGRSLDMIRVVGGGSLNAFLMQMTADACDRRVVAGPAEASSIGNIMLQAIATGHLPDITAGRNAVAASVSRSSFEPRTSSAWEHAYSRFKQVERSDEGIPILTTDSE